MIETTDVFRSAYLLAQGATLSQVTLSDRGRKRVTFVLEGAEVAQWDQAYFNGSAHVNPLRFRHFVNHVRDVLFETLRAENTRTTSTRKEKRR